MERLKTAGVQVEALHVPELAEILPVAGPLLTGEAYGLWGAVIEANPHLMFDRILERFRMGRDVSAADFVSGWRKVKAARAAWARATAGFDAVLAPTCPILPPELARLESDPDYYVTENLLSLRNTRVGNALGLSALTLPTGTPSCGIMLLAAPMAEEALLRIGAAAERALA